MTRRLLKRLRSLWVSAIAELRRVQVTLEPPQVGRRRLVATVVLCATATALWISAPIIAPDFLPAASVTWVHVAVGFGVPGAIGWVTLLLMEHRILREHGPAQRSQSPQQPARLRQIEHRAVRELPAAGRPQLERAEVRR